MIRIAISEVMRQSGVVFGTSGARGRVEQMNDDVCQAYASAFLEVVGRSFRFDRVALGMDLRPSSPGIAAACAQAIRAAGLQVDFCGALPTPALAYYAQLNRIPAIMVTGSHIPFDRNGIKFYRPDGEISKADEAAIGAATVELTGEDTASLPPVNALALQSYEQRYLEFFPHNMLSGFRIGLYEHSSVARDSLSRILKTFGAEVESIGRTDVFVPIDTEAVSEEDIRRGRAWAEAYGLDAIISTDGDGDRPLISDENGAWLRGDIVGLITARHLGIKLIALPVSCNTAIEKSGYFDRVIRTRIGSPYVIEAMHQLKQDKTPIAGFEANGGFLLGGDVSRGEKVLEALPTRDAILPILSVLAAAREAGTSVSGLLRDLPERYTASDRLQNFPAENSRALLDEWSLDFDGFLKLVDGNHGKIIQHDTTDGLRMIFTDQTIIHLRPSGNAPELRCYVEADSPEGASHITKSVLSKIRTFRR